MGKCMDKHIITNFDKYYKETYKGLTKIGGLNLDWGIKESFSQEITFKLKLAEQLGITPDEENKEET